MVKLKVGLVFNLPDFVVINITPFAAREPYKDVEDASFNTVIDSTWSCDMLLIFPLKGTPSKIIKGEVEAFIDPTPRINILGLSPGCPPEEIIFTPVVDPCKALTTLGACCFCNTSLSIVVTAPTIASFFCLP